MMPLRRSILLWLSPLFCALAGAAPAADIYRWVDDAGSTQYGHMVPEQYKSRARRVDAVGEPTAEQVREAEARASREREAAARISEEKARDEKAKPAVAAQRAAAPPANPNETACEREWRKFAESNECFAPYMIAGGGIRPEAFKKCVEVKAPTCGPPPPHPAKDR
jgi:hypothetical protein